jgi:hypothetical protein
MKMFGIESNKPLEELENNFVDVRMDEDYHTLESKEVIQPEIDGRTINCKVAVKVVDFYHNVDPNAEPGHFLILLELVPQLDQFTPAKLASIARTAGIEPSDVNFNDVCDDGSYVPLGSADVYGVKGYDDPKLIDAVKFVGTNVVPAVKGLIGFYLDAPINGSGDNGWKLLKDIVG